MIYRGGGGVGAVGVSSPALFFHRLWTQPEHEPNLSGQPTPSSRQSGFSSPTAKWQQARREENKTNKSGQSISLRNHISAGASQAHDVPPLPTHPTPPDSEGEGRRGLSAPSLPLWSSCFPSQPFASSAVNLAVIICPPFTSSHEKWRIMSWGFNSKIRSAESNTDCD